MRSSIPKTEIGAVLIAALAIAACGSDERPGPAEPVVAGAVGASIAASPSAVYVVDPDQGSVSAIDPTTLDPLARAPVGAEPRALLLDGDRLFVTTHRGGDLVVLAASDLHELGRAHVCAMPWGIARAPDGGALYVACETAGSVVRVDPASLAVTTLATGFSRPRALIATSAGVVVADFTGGMLHVVGSSGARADVSLVPTTAGYRPALTRMSANLATAIAPVDGGLLVAHQLVNHTGDATDEIVADDYGSVRDGNPKINPAVTELRWVDGALVPRADRPVTYATFDGSFRAFASPEAIAVAADGRVVVAHVASSRVAILDRDAVDPATRAIASVAVGSGPSGVAIAGDVAFVDAAFDGSVSRIDPTALAAGANVAPLTRLRGLEPAYSAAALAGRKTFYGADDPHLTPAGVVACASCHPGGGDDGLTWFIHTADIPLKRRRTPHLANAHSGTEPFHWDGSFSTMDELTSSTVHDLMAGDGLLLTQGQVRAFIDEIVLPPLPEPGDEAAIARGRAAFADAGCATCHAGDAQTDGLLHAPLAPMSLTDDDAFTRANTPALRGLGVRAPYFHDGRAATLRDVLVMPGAEAHRGALPDESVDDVVAYLLGM